MNNLELRAPYGATRGKKRVGRGPGSGMGKTSTRGHKGQKSRKSGGVRLGFEGGQTPLYRRLPKRGFSNSKFADSYFEINLYTLNAFKDGDIVNRETLKKQGFKIGTGEKIKVLSKGDISKKLEIQASKFSALAKEKIEKAGGKATII